MHGLRKLMMVLLVLILPVQGVAAAFAPLHQATDPQSAAVPCHGHQADAQDSHPSPHGGTSGTHPDNDATSHMCCHQVFSCAPATAVNTVAQKVSDAPQTVPLLHAFFVPDSPYRPPRG